MTTPGQAASCAPSDDLTIFDRVSLFHFPTDVLLNVVLLLAPRDLSRLASTSDKLSNIPKDNYIWYKLTVQRFVIDAEQRKKESGSREVAAAVPVWAKNASEVPTISAVTNWYDEYEYLLASESRAQKYKMAQMQGRLGRLPPLPAHKNRPVINVFQM
jgi:hypothetical protein